MFTMQHFFSVIPHDTALQRYATQGERVAKHNFCRGLVTTAVSAALELAREEALAPAIPRRSGRPRGSLNVEIFIRGLVNKIVDTACASVATTKKQTYRKWSESEKDMALHIAHEKSSDSRAVSFLATRFPKTFAQMRESHIRDFRRQAEQAAARLPDGRGRSTMVSSPCLSEIVQCIQAHVACRLEFTTIQMRCVILAMIEEQHPDILAKSFTASVDWLNVLMRETMPLPMMKIGTAFVPSAFSHASIQQHRLVLLCVAYLVDRHDVARSMVVSRN